MTHNSLLAVATTAGLHRIAARFKTLARFVKLPRCLGQTTHTKKTGAGPAQNVARLARFEADGRPRIAARSHRLVRSQSRELNLSILRAIKRRPLPNLHD